MDITFELSSARGASSLRLRLIGNASNQTRHQLLGRLLDEIGSQASVRPVENRLEDAWDYDLRVTGLTSLADLRTTVRDFLASLGLPQKLW